MPTQFKTGKQPRDTTLVDITFTDVAGETPKAWHLDIDGDLYWLPKSECELYESEKVVTMPSWLAVEKGLA